MGGPREDWARRMAGTNTSEAMRSVGACATGNTTASRGSAVNSVAAPPENRQGPWWGAAGLLGLSPSRWLWPTCAVWGAARSLAPGSCAPEPGQNPRYAPLAPASGMKPTGISARSNSAGNNSHANRRCRRVRKWENARVTG